jgi:hypothetical protein
MSIRYDPIEVTEVTGLYALWAYSQTYIGGTITRMREDGHVETMEYGKNQWFKPFVIVPIKRGIEMRNKLELLARERQAKIEEIDKITRAAMDAVVNQEGI